MPREEWQAGLGLAVVEQGSGRVVPIVSDVSGDSVQLRLGIQAHGYANAQLDDYHAVPGGKFTVRPPARLTLEACFQTAGREVVGTAGFGFWNAPFGGRRRWPVLPTAIWFFYGGAPTHLPFASGMPGGGWKAAVIHAHHPLAYVLLPLGLPSALLMRRRHIYRSLWPMAERVLKISEYSLAPDLMFEKHKYDIEWRSDRIIFRIDKEIVHIAPESISGPLGTVIWLDNQFLIATPQGEIRWGTTNLSGRQQMHVKRIKLERLEAAGTIKP